MEPFQAVGLALVVAAIVGGGLEAAGFKIGVVESRPRQLMLAGLGALVFVFGTPQVWSWARPEPPPVMSVVATATPAPPTPTLVPTTAPSSTATAALTATTVPTATPEPTTVPVATTVPAATSAPSAPAGRTPILPGVRKDGDRRP